MKRILPVLLVFALCFGLFGCDKAKDDAAIPVVKPIETPEIEQLSQEPYDVNAEAEKLLAGYLATLEKIDTPSHEYGEHLSFISMDDKLVVNIIYPETGLSFLDEQINDWINETFEYYSDDAAEALFLSQPAELNVSCESHVENERYLSIKMTGFYNSEHLAHPVDIVKVFNADIKNCNMLEAKQLFCNDEAYNRFLVLASERLGVDLETTDEHFLDNLFVRQNGVEITLARGSYMPMSDGTKSIFVGADELNEMLVVGFNASDESLTQNDKDADDEDKQEDEGKTVSGEPPSPSVVDTSKPMIALTFDDGPSKHTERLLDILQTYGGKATFFVLGSLIDARSETLRRTVNEGHEIGNHTWGHKQLTSLSSQEVADEIMLTRAKILDVAGVDCRIVRPPYGASNEDVLNIGEELGVSFVNWSVDTLDWKSKNADAVYNEIIGIAKNGDIVLCHDLHKTTVDAMETVIPKLIADGYQLVTVSELFEFSEKELASGKMHYRA